MKCRMVDAEPRDVNGCRRVKCDRLGCGRVSKSRTPCPPEHIHFPCSAWPEPWEWGHWLALVLDVLMLSKSRVNWLAMKLNLIDPGDECGLGCDAREKWLNTLGGKAVVRYRAVRAWLSRICCRSGGSGSCARGGGCEGKNISSADDAP